MALFGSVFRQLFECFAQFLRRRETPQRAQHCVAQELAAVEKLPEECEAFDFNANGRKCRKRCRKVPEKYQLGEREEEREEKNNKGGSHKDEAERDTVTLGLEKVKKREHVVEKKREMHSLEKLEEGSELREAGEKRRKERKRKKQKITEPTALIVEVKPVHTTITSSFLKPIEGELSMLPSVSRHHACFKPLPPVTKPPVHPQKPAPEDVLSLPCSPLQVDPSKLLPVPPCPDEVVSSSQMLPLAVPPRPTLAPDELVSCRCSSSKGRPPKPQTLPLAVLQSPTPAPAEDVALPRPPSRKPQPFTSSLFKPSPQLMLVDIEDEENEYVEYTGMTIRASDLLKSELSQMQQADVKPRKMVAWLEKDSEVQEKAWASKVVKVQGFEEEEGDPSEKGDSKTMQGHSDDASQIDERMMKLFCVTSPDGPKNETQHNVSVQKKCKRKVPLVLFTWATEKVKKKEEKKKIKEKEQREKELLLQRYLNDPKLKHLLINKNNHNYNSF